MLVFNNITSVKRVNSFKHVAIVKGVGKAYNQMNGGSANGDAFVNWHLTTGLSLQVARTAIFILLRVDHVQCHVTPPHSSLPIHVLVP